jgi:hypothetical protein
MAAEDTLDTLERSFQSALLADRFTEACALLDRYVDEVRGRIETLPGPETMRAFESRVCRFFDCGSALASAARERAAGDLGHLRRLSHYARPLDSGGPGTRA